MHLFISNRNAITWTMYQKEKTCTNLNHLHKTFQVNYFKHFIDLAISSLARRFEQYQEFQNTFGFLFTSDKLCSLDDKSLLSSCVNLDAALRGCLDLGTKN